MTLTRYLALSTLTAFGLFGFLLPLSAHSQNVSIGAASYVLNPKGQDPRPPAAPHRTPDLLTKAAPTNQWYSTLIFHDKPEAIFAHPLSVKPTQAGIEVSLPRQEVVPTERQDVEIHYAHKNPLRISSSTLSLGKAKLARTSDWSIDISQSQGQDQLLATVTHGSPYVYFQVSRGNLRIDLPAEGKKIESLSGQPLALKAHHLVLEVNGQFFALFAPTGAKWEVMNDRSWALSMPEGKGYLSLAALPDSSIAAFKLLQEHAYAFVSDTKVSWEFDSAKSQVKTQFDVSSKMMEGIQRSPLLGLYPHHWHQNATVTDKLGPAYDTIRGPIKLLASNSFATQFTYNGFVPFWPGVKNPLQAKELSEVTKTDVRNARRMMLEIGVGPYWQGKGLQRIAKLMDVVEQQGDLAARDQLLATLKTRIEKWFSGKDNKTYFHSKVFIF